MFFSSYLEAPRHQLFLSHTLVCIVVSYQLVFSHEPLLPHATLNLLVALLLCSIGGLMFLPQPLLDSRSLVPVLVGTDTAVTACGIYISGTASSRLYASFFLIMLIAAFTTDPRLTIGLSILVCSAYAGVMLLQQAPEGALRVDHVLQLPVLLIMMTLYGATQDLARRLSREKQMLVKNLNE